MVLAIDVDLITFEVWLIEYIQQKYAALNPNATSPATLPDEAGLRESPSVARPFSVQFSFNLVLPGTDDPQVVLFDMTPLPGRGLRVAVRAAVPGDNAALNMLVYNIQQEWMDKLIQTAVHFTALSIEEKGLLLLQQLYDRVKADTGMVVSLTELDPTRFTRDEAFQTMYYLLGKGWIQTGPATADSPTIRLTPRGAKEIEAGLERRYPTLAVEIQNVLVERFDLEEFRQLCFRLGRFGIHFDNLRGQGLVGKAIELVAYFQRRHQLPQLMEEIRQERPDIKFY